MHIHDLQLTVFGYTLQNTSTVRCPIYVLSLLTAERIHIVNKNKIKYPHLNIVQCVNGYNKEEVVAEFKTLNLKYHHLQFRTYGMLACWITKYKMIKHQVDAKIPFMCFIEDDVILEDGFDEFLQNSLPIFKNGLNIIRLARWGEGYITSLAGARRIINSHLSKDGVIRNIDNQLRVNCGEELRIQGAPIKLAIATNKGDILKTPVLNECEFCKL